MSSVPAGPASRDAVRSATSVAPLRVKDELAWELVRDEWELLLAIGSGPTSIDVAAKAIELPATQVARRIALLEQHGLVRNAEGGFSLVPAFYERREGMSSYVRDLVLRRLQEESAPPLAGRACLALGGSERLEALIARAEAELFPAVVQLASRPESPESQRFSVFFAVADAPSATGSMPFRNQLLEILRAAATARSLDPESRHAYLWVAEMRVDPEVAVEIGDLFERFLEVPRRSSSNPLSPAGSPGGTRQQAGAAVFAVMPASGRARPKPPGVP